MVTGLFVLWTIRTIYFYLWRVNSGQKPAKIDQPYFIRRNIAVATQLHAERK